MRIFNTNSNEKQSNDYLSCEVVYAETICVQSNQNWTITEMDSVLVERATALNFWLHLLFQDKRWKGRIILVSNSEFQGLFVLSQKYKRPLKNNTSSFNLQFVKASQRDVNWQIDQFISAAAEFIPASTDVFFVCEERALQRVCR